VKNLIRTEVAAGLTQVLVGKMCAHYVWKKDHRTSVAWQTLKVHMPSVPNQRGSSAKKEHNEMSIAEKL